MSGMIPWEHVATATRAPATNVLLHWPLLYDGLVAEGIGGRLTQIAVAATTAVECPGFAPVRERRANAKRQPFLYQSQGRYWDSGFYGRGFIQLTWEENYRTYGERLGLDLVGHPDLALDPTVAARIMAAYCKSRGVSTAAEAEDWVRVRRKVNGGLTGWDAFKPVVDKLLAATA